MQADARVKSGISAYVSTRCIAGSLSGAGLTGGNTKWCGHREKVGIRPDNGSVLRQGVGVCEDTSVRDVNRAASASDNRASVTLDKYEVLHAFFERQVDVHPDKVALVWREEKLTYRELDEKANQLARYLRSVGAGPGELVGLYLERSSWAVISILAVLKSGAGYVPLDPGHPGERTRLMLEDAEVKVILTVRQFQPQIKFFSGRVVTLDEEWELISRQASQRLTPEETGVSGEDIAYVIFSSGTTGRPKGILTQHRNVVHFVKAFREICSLEPTDRVLQGFALCFDGSVEEMWMAFSNGATLVVGSGNPEETAQLINREKVTFFSTVPTFLSMIDEELPTVRLLVVSGEPCSAELVERWARPGRRMLNVYGPTEATVNTTAAECVPGKPVTIGRSLPGYVTYVLDTDGQPVKPGEEGELYIGGPGVAKGYLNRPELTARHFLTLCISGSDRPERLYRTGDLVRENGEGELIFIGRVDTQVKIRGYRVELSEIEAVLRECPGIKVAAVKVVHRDGIPQLAAYAVPERKGSSLERDEILRLLRARLPAYMVPAFLDELDQLPTLASGKIDRRRLPEPKRALIEERRRVVPPSGSLERSLVEIWEKVLRISPLSVEDDFFADLGGHSLLAAQVVSALRNELKIEASLRDLYRYPTVRQLAGYLESSCRQGKADEREMSASSSQAGKAREILESVPVWVRLGCIFLQTLSLGLFSGIVAIPSALIVMLAIMVYDGSLDLMAGLGIVLGIIIVWPPASLLLSLGVKWLVIGRFRPGRYPLWGFYYFRWWLVMRVQRLSGAALFALSGTPLMNVYYRLMGASVGPGCIIDTAQCAIFDLVTIGEDTSIGHETQLLGYRVEGGELVLGRIEIGKRCLIGIHSTLGLNTRMGDDCRLDDLSVLEDGEVMAPGEARRGSPSRKAEVKVPLRQDVVSKPRRPVLFGLLHFVAAYALGFVMITTIIPPLLLLVLGVVSGSSLVFVSTCVASVPAYVVSFCLLVALLKAVLLGRVEPGVYPIESSFYLRKWLIDGLIRASCWVVRPLYTTVYLPPWLRLLGARIGAWAEISTVSQISPELMELGEGSFFADGSIIGGRRLFRGCVEYGVSRVGRRSFVGNSAILPVGTGLGDSCLLGCLSAPPEVASMVPDGTEWLGSPSFRLPNRQKVGGFDTTVTYRPTRRLYVERCLVDAVRILFPGLVGVFEFVGFVMFVYCAYRGMGMVATLAWAPWVGIAIVALGALSVVVLKRVIMGRFEPVIKPLWSRYVWWNEVINGAYESVGAPSMSPLLGTPFFAYYLRLLGCKVGRHVFIETTLFSEFDLVEIGDYASLNSGAVIQNHLFEDRIMKSSYLRIGDECTVGNMAVVLYDTVMHTGAWLGPLSLLMKGETLAPGTKWRGIPTVPASG